MRLGKEEERASEVEKGETEKTASRGKNRRLQTHIRLEKTGSFVAITKIHSEKREGF